MADDNRPFRNRLERKSADQAFGFRRISIDPWVGFRILLDSSDQTGNSCPSKCLGAKTRKMAEEQSQLAISAFGTEQKRKANSAERVFGFR